VVEERERERERVWKTNKKNQRRDKFSTLPQNGPEFHQIKSTLKPPSTVKANNAQNNNNNEEINNKYEQTGREF
jgi:hypothetical protein